METAPIVADIAESLQLRTCPLCEGMCGVEVRYRGDAVVSVRPDRENVHSRGHICPKGTTLGDLHHTQDRLRMPVIKVDGAWQEISWQSALEHCEALIAPVLQEHGSASIAAYTGNMIAKSFDLVRYVGVLFQQTNLGGIYSSSTVDQHPKNVASMLMFGNMWSFAIPDIDRTDFMLLMGGNPAASKGSIFAHRDVMGAIKALRARGGRIVVVDPVETGTARAAGEWLPIVPGSDAALLLAIVHTLFAEDRVRLGILDGKVNGLDDLRDAAAYFTAERVADFCDIPAETIRDLARQISDAPTAAIYGRIGLCTQRFGSLATWLTDVVAILTGNMGTPGGVMFSTQVASHLDLTPPYPSDAPLVTRYSRVSGVPAILGMYPAGTLAEEIDTPGDGRTRGLFTIAANPVLSAPGSDRLERALPMLDFMISFDSYINETTSHADVILPGPSPLEQAHWDVWAWPWCLTSGGHYSPPLFEQDRMEEWRVVMTIAALLRGTPLRDIDTDAMDDEHFAGMCGQLGLDPERVAALAPAHGPERILELAIRGGHFGDRYGERDGLTLDDFKARPHGLLTGIARPGVPIATTSGKVEISPAHLLADLPRLREAMAEPRPDAYLVSRRTLRSMNSWMNNVPVLAKGPERCTLLIHPEDAARIGVADRDLVAVLHDENKIIVPAEITSHIKRGVVSIPHGWGHDRPGSRLSVAREKPGVNANSLNPAGLRDAPSGNAVVNGVPVTLMKVTQ